MMPSLAKRKYLVESNGIIGKEVYSATDPDEAVRLAHRAEIFFNLICSNPKISGEKAIMLSDEAVEKGVGASKFMIEKITEVKK